MIVPDINLLVYAYNADLPPHDTARRWWESLVNNPSADIGLPWVVVLGFLRIMTHPRIFERPMRANRAMSAIRTWFERPNLRVLSPGPRHVEILEDLLAEAGTAGPLTTDVHLAALAIEYGAVLYSNDTDFHRFSGLQLVNPLA